MQTRVLNIMLAKGRGGVETMAVRYHEALKAEGYATLSVGHPDGMMAQDLNGRDFLSLDTFCNHDPLAALKLALIVRRFQPDVILTHGNRATGLCLMPFVTGDVRAVQVLHNQCYKPHLKRARAALCVSGNVIDGLGQAYPDVRRLEVANFAHLESHPVKGRPGLRPIIGAMGRLHEVKSFDLLIRSAAALRDAGRDFLLRIAGDGPQRDALTALVSELGLQNHVEFVGWVADPHAFMSSLDLFVMSSRYEAFGLVVIEAMAAGVPVVSADIDGPREILQQGRLGTLFRSGDAQSLARAVGAVFADWSGSLRRARQAQTHAMATFGFDAGRRRLAQALQILRYEDSFWLEARELPDPYAIAAE